MTLREFAGATPQLFSKAETRHNLQRDENSCRQDRRRYRWNGSLGSWHRKRGQMKVRLPSAFDVVKELGCSLPNVEAATRYDGSPVLKAHGVFMAGLAMHASAEPDTLVVRAEFEEREGLLEDAPDTYYVTDYYRRYPVVLVRL